jgi:protein TonB
MRFKYVYRDDSLVDFVDVLAQKHDTSSKDSAEKESEFPGGVSRWLRYLNKNLKYPDRAINSKIDGQVRVCFIVDKEGNVIDPFIAKSVEWSLDDESVAIIKASGQWTPAIQFGKIVKSYKLQPIVYRLE